MEKSLQSLTSFVTSVKFDQFQHITTSYLQHILALKGFYRTYGSSLSGWKPFEAKYVADNWVMIYSDSGPGYLKHGQ